MENLPAESDLELAHAIADRLDALTLERFGAQDLVIEHKPDTTEVTDADKNAEILARQILEAERPADQIIGEEFGSTAVKERQWVIDPIDGTANFVRGVPIWASLIGLIENGKPKMGLVSAPAINQRWWGEIGVGAFKGTLESPERIQVSKVNKLQDAFISYSSLSDWTERGKLTQFVSLIHQCWRSRAFGDFYSYMLLAEGLVDIAVEPDLKLHDMVALVPIVEAAGGKFTDLLGNDGPFGANALASNTLVHDQALELINFKDLEN